MKHFYILSLVRFGGELPPGFLLATWTLEDDPGVGIVELMGLRGHGVCHIPLEQN